MIILPAIDIYEGQCVRLLQGNFQTAHKVAHSYIETALSFKKRGAEWIHMVDLDGAKEGKRINSQVFIDVAEKTGLKVELGGGIRNISDISYYLDNGISRVILGSAAIDNPALVEAAVKKYGDKIAVGIDARNGVVKTAGWITESEADYIETARHMDAIGIEVIIYTDISRDGTLTGPNLEHLKRLKDSVSSKIIASGGIGGPDDIKKLAELDLYGAICGKSIYNGDLDLKEAIEMLKTEY